jgi:hypothetical protein
MASIITALKQQARDPQRVAVHVDGEFACGAALAVVLAAGLRTGEPVTPETLERLRDADERWRAKQAALALLAVRPRARRELADRLRTRQFPADVVDWALAEADRLGLLDDTAFAESWDQGSAAPAPARQPGPRRRARAQGRGPADGGGRRGPDHGPPGGNGRGPVHGRRPQMARHPRPGRRPV